MMSLIPDKRSELRTLVDAAAKPALTAKFIILTSISILLIDLGYKLFAGITAQAKESCILYSTLPRWGFLLYESIIELFLVVIAGIFTATVIEKYSSRFRRYLPHNCLTAFVYASALPICSCGAIPLIRSMENRIPFRAIITFVIAAPLLNPYIIMVSVTVLGIEYALVRIICSMILAVATGYVVEYFQKSKNATVESTACGGCSKGSCRPPATNVFDAAFRVIVKIAPFIALAGILSFGMEMVNPGSWLRSLEFDGGIIGTLGVILAGVPIYFCNGADVLFLKPFIHHGAIDAGSAVAFSLTSTSICISSLAMLLKFVGRRTTVVILISIVSITILMSLLVQVLPIDIFSNIHSP